MSIDAMADALGFNNSGSEGGQGTGGGHGATNGRYKYPAGAIEVGNSSYRLPGDPYLYDNMFGSKTYIGDSPQAPTSGGGGSAPSHGGGGGGGGGSSRPAAIQDTRDTRAADSAAALQAALAGARTGLGDEFKRYGIDLAANDRGNQDRFGWEGSSYNDEIDRYLNQISRTVDPLDENPAQYLNNYDQMFQDLRGNIETDTRGRLGRGLNAFTDRSVTDARFADDFGSNVTNSIYDDQYGSAETTLDRAFKRGTLSQNAYDIALGDLGASSSGARDRLDTYRSGNLNSTRQSLYDFGQQGHNSLGNFDLGGSFDTGGYQSQLDNKFNTLSSGFEGQLRNTIGGEQFFDTNSLIGAGHAGAGVENTKFTAPLWLQAQDETKQNNEQFRGIGSQGGF
ncbi:hypothetical protein DRQ25_11245 [Candidatus Fermentibacteria bacterium]|nr:MAG: hypothetical protein DRQ25_11245 [Candidatus Fermentibacteria bacterium]